MNTMNQKFKIKKNFWRGRGGDGGGGEVNRVSDFFFVYKESKSKKIIGGGGGTGRWEGMWGAVGG